MPVLLVQAMLAAWDLRYAEARPLLDEAEALLGSRPGEQWPLIAPFVRLLLDELPAAVDGISRVVELLRAFGAVDLLPTPLLMLSRVRILTGNPMEARTCLEEAMTLVESIGGQLAVGEYFESERDLLLTEISALVGDRTACLAHAAATLRRRGGGNDNIARCRARRALGVLALGGGDAPEARSQLRILDEEVRVLGLHDIPSVWWLADLAEAELLVGDRPAVLNAQQRLWEQAEATGTANARALHQLIRAWDQGEAADMVNAAEQFALSQRFFESARARFAAGQVFRRRKEISEAREQLRHAYDDFEGIGAEAWQQRAHSELRACGVAVKRAGSHSADLTAQEYQVAQRAAFGATNAEIASALFLSPKTVEFHLGNAFRKLV